MICTECERHFFKRWSRRFCSKLCSRRFHNRRLAIRRGAKRRASRPLGGMCEWCGRPIIKIGKRGAVRAICSERCRAMQRQRDRRRSFFCRNCGKRYIGQKGQPSKHCSEECRLISSRSQATRWSRSRRAKQMAFDSIATRRKSAERTRRWNIANRARYLGTRRRWQEANRMKLREMSWLRNVVAPILGHHPPPYLVDLLRLCRDVKRKRRLQAVGV